MPYQLLSQKAVYCGKAFTVDSVLLEFPDGHQTCYDLVRHNSSVTIVPLDAEGYVFFVRQYRLGAGRELLELPAGVMETGESAENCALREIREEIGLAAGRLTSIGQAYLVPGYGDELMYFFMAEELTENPLHPDQDEVLKIERYSIQEAYEMAEQGKLQDSKSLAALMLARPALMAK
ncbi:MAG: NUDIX hydrolase [Anaerolineaceae bacterium]|nr:NUDIX hydrolase [Anaerolineaceae bacterium]MBN2677128.1 NUDIX hydrolase [Anaerolineaceae bacterium]